MNEKDVFDAISKSMREEERKNERRIHLARMSIFSLVLMMMSVSRLMLGEALNTRFVLVGMFSASCLGIGILLWRYFQDHRHSVLAKYLLVTLEVGFVFVLVLIVRYTMSREVYEVTSDIPAFLVLFLVNATSGLRFDFRLSAYSALASVVALTGLTIFDLHTHSMSHPYLVVTSLFKGMMLLGVALVSGYIGTSARKLVMHDYKEQSAKRYVTDLFGKYVTPEIRDLILAGRIPLNGARTEATVLIADLCEFTPYVEASEPEEVVMSLREYFTTMQSAVRRHQGLVLQYVGDEIEVAFGAPVPCDDHADKAVLAALEMNAHLGQLNRNRIREGKQPFRHRIGIHTGQVLAANTGSEDQPSYALIGDTVNVAARLQELNKTYGTDIIISASTKEHMRSDVRTQKLDTATLKGISRPIETYTLDGSEPRHIGDSQ